jgi:hypothetical protein
MSQSNRYIEHILNAKSLRWVSNQVSAQLDRKLSKYEIAELVNYAKKQKHKDWKHRPSGKLMSINDIRETIAYQFWLDQMGGYETLPKKEQRKLRGPGGSSGAPMKYNRQQSDVKQILKAYTGNLKDGFDVDFDKMDDRRYMDEDGQPHDPTIEEDVDIFEEGGTIGNVGTIETIERLLKIDEVGIVHQVGNIERLFGKSDAFQLQALLNPQAQQRSAYITMDSKYRLTSTTGETEIAWNFLNNSATNTQGAVNSIGNVQNLIAMKIHRFRIPYLDAADNSFKKVTMLIEEFRAQSYIAQEDWRYHFQFSPEVDGNQINLIPWPAGVESGRFNFRTPITQINTMTIMFGSPLTPIVFDRDRRQAAVTHNANGLFTTTDTHNLLTGDIVSFTEFTSLDPATDEPTILDVNSIEGHSVVVIDDFNFEIGVDLTAVTLPLIPQVIFAYFESKRIIIDLELIYEDAPPDY